VSIGILDLHLVRPRVVGWRMSDLGSLDAVVLEERLDVPDADPDSGPGIPLVTFAQHDVAAVTRDRCHDPGFVPINFEPEHPHVVVNTSRKASDPENRGDAFKHGCGLL
jgi:hypothetical protein